MLKNKFSDFWYNIFYCHKQFITLIFGYSIFYYHKQFITLIFVLHNYTDFWCSLSRFELNINIFSHIKPIGTIIIICNLTYLGFIFSLCMKFIIKWIKYLLNECKLIEFIFYVICFVDLIDIFSLYLLFKSVLLLLFKSILLCIYFWYFNRNIQFKYICESVKSVLNWLFTASGERFDRHKPSDNCLLCQ